MKRKRKKSVHLTEGRNAYLRLLFVTLLLSALSLTGRAQCSMANTAFAPGEKLTFNLYYNWKFVWVKAGTASLEMKETTYNGKPAYKMELESVTNKKVDFFFRMRDTIISVFTHQIEPLYYRKGAEEGKRYTVDQAWFSYAGGKTTVKQERLYQDGNKVITDYTGNHCVYDMLSAMANARSYDTSEFAKGDKIDFPMVTGKKVAHEVVVYKGKKNIKADNDITYRCLVFTFSEVNKETGKVVDVLTFYITDDQNHLPVRLDMHLNIGSAKAYMTSVTGNRYPITAQVK